MALVVHVGARRRIRLLLDNASLEDVLEDVKFLRCLHLGGRTHEHPASERDRSGNDNKGKKAIALRWAAGWCPRQQRAGLVGHDRSGFSASQVLSRGGY